MKLRSAGMTLIELLIVLVIIGILAAFAVPSYSKYVQRARVVEVTGDLGQGRVTFEQYYLDNRSYNGATCPTATNGTYFTIACTVTQDANSNPATYSTYTLTATGKGTMAGFIYTVDQTNSRTTQGPFVSTSIYSSGTAPCWIFRKGDSC